MNNPFGLPDAVFNEVQAFELLKLVLSK